VGSLPCYLHFFQRQEAYGCGGHLLGVFIGRTAHVTNEKYERHWLHLPTGVVHKSYGFRGHSLCGQEVVAPPKENRDVPYEQRHGAEVTCMACLASLDDRSNHDKNFDDSMAQIYATVCELSWGR
jgi:hypothetical protein